MKNLVQTLFVLGMIFLHTYSFGQSSGLGSEVPKTYLDFFISAVGTDLNYGESNKSLKDFKKSEVSFFLYFSWQKKDTGKA